MRSLLTAALFLLASGSALAYNWTPAPTPVPEPDILVLAAIGAAAVGFFARKKKDK